MPSNDLVPAGACLSRLSVFIFPSTKGPAGQKKGPWLLDRERRGQFEEKGSHFESAYFLTFVWAMQGMKSKKVSGLFYDDPECEADSAIENHRDIDFFTKSCHEIADLMRGVFVDVVELNDDQTLTYLHSTISTNRHVVKCPDVPMYLDALLPDQALTVADIPMLGDQFIPTVTITGFPSTSLPGILDELNHLEIEYRWVTRYICLDKDDARKEIEKFRRQWWSKRKNLFTMLKEEATKERRHFLTAMHPTRLLMQMRLCRSLGRTWSRSGL